ncbi:GlxA family transcriptional regulator [Sorangium sp. So ce887]|uniref:GlxA family transcriptional regulator n=1 Tax=Sorangium sp. So ce887 TaxID=3133324 RepID=UPI003F60DBD9
MARASRSVWFFVFPDSELLDLTGPWEVLGHANEVLGWRAYALDLVTSLGGEVRTRHGLVVGGARSLRAGGYPEVTFVAGGSPFLPLPPSEARLVRWLRRHHGRVPTIVSICTGAFVLGEAGLLEGRRVTTHWRFLDDLRARFPGARVVDEGIFVRDGRLWTSAGITTGIDLTLALVEEDHGHRVAMAVAKNLVLFLRRSGHQAQFSPMLRRQESEPARLRDLSSFVLEHIDEPLPVERVARAAGMSPRSLARWCRAELGESPAELVRRHRVEEARRLLEGTALSLKEVAARTGLGDASTLWRAFSRRLGVTPAEYRERFAEKAPQTVE